MPHSLNIDGVSESLFLIQTLAHGSKSFCETHQIKWGEEVASEFQWDYYFGWLKSLLCENLIKSSITLRMLQDIVTAQEQDGLDLSLIEASAMFGLSLGTVSQGGFSLTLRESFNKIIHATDTLLVWEDSGDSEFWTGRIILTGRLRASEWKLELDVINFCIAANRFVESVGGEVDWNRLYKYDH
jgi:hypothetical protein